MRKLLLLIGVAWWMIGTFHVSASGQFVNRGGNVNGPADSMTVSNCDPAALFYAVQYKYSHAMGHTSCVYGLAPGSGLFQIDAYFGSAVTQDAATVAVGGSFYGFARGQGTTAFGINPLVQDYVDSFTNISFIGGEFDLQAMKAPSAYTNGVGVHVALVNNTQIGGTYPFNAFSTSTTVNGGATPAFFANVLYVATNSLNAGSIVNAQPLCSGATNTANCGGPVLLRSFLNQWNGSTSVSSDYDLRVDTASGSNPAWDMFHIFRNGAGAATNHYLGLDAGIKLAFVRSGGFYTLDGPVSGNGTQDFYLPALGVATSGTLGLGISLPAGTPSFVQGSGVTSVGCATGYTCTNMRGRLTIAAGTATTGAIATVNFSASLTPAPGLVMLREGGSTSAYGLDHGIPTATGFTITSANSVSGATLNVDYNVLP